MQCKCYVCSYQHMANSSFAFWSFLEFFPLIFLILVSWIRECRTHGYRDVLMFLLGTSWSRGREFPTSSHHWTLERSSLCCPEASWLGAQIMCWIRFGQVWCLISRLFSSVRDQSFRTGFLAWHIPSRLLLTALCVWMKNVCFTKQGPVCEMSVYS